MGEESKPAEIKTWKEIVTESNGQLMFVPDQFIDEVKAWAESRQKVEDFINEMSLKGAKMENEMTVKLQNLVFGVRQYLDKNGLEKIWLSDIGIEVSALKEKEFILTIKDPKKEGLPM